ncbi:MAG: bifunctional riboflavin kinase/FAD synthetase [Clostridia bacterium]|nr:bifunctional riboflavin kinase/FAD synthetase [Clostridia bacterium]
MQMLWNPSQMQACVLVLGMFDGVHRAHRTLFAEGRTLADAYGVPLCVCTFEPHPLELLAPAAAPARLSTQSERAQLIAEAGVDFLCVHRFTRELADQEPDDFLRDILRIYRPVALVCGYNFTFGRRGAGTVDRIRAFCAAQGIRASVIPPVLWEGQPISSTRVRAALEAGDLPLANQLLGHPYSLCGTVVHGKGLGHTLSYPTANLQVSSKKLLPAYGVYVCTLETADRRWPAVVNIGRHPTVPDGSVTVEAFVLEGSPELYGAQARLRLLERLRAEQTFAGLDALHQQLSRDAGAARTWFSQTKGD